jgi:hypothetical protein
MEPANRAPSLALVAEREIIEVELLMAVARIGKELFEEIAHQSGLNAVEVVLAVAAKTDEPGHAQQGEMVADGRLRLIKQVAQSRYMQLTILRQREQDFETGFVSQQFEDLGQTVNGPLRNLERGRQPLGEFASAEFSGNG